MAMMAKILVFGILRHILGVYKRMQGRRIQELNEYTQTHITVHTEFTLCI